MGVNVSSGTFTPSSAAEPKAQGCQRQQDGEGNSARLHWPRRPRSALDDHHHSHERYQAVDEALEGGLRDRVDELTRNRLLRKCMTATNITAS